VGLLPMLQLSARKTDYFMAISATFYQVLFCVTTYGTDAENMGKGRFLRFFDVFFKKNLIVFAFNHKKPYICIQL